MRRKPPHIGLRAFKTALAVGLALMIAGLRDAALPVFAGIGAISAMSRTLYDSRKAAFSELCGIIIGAVMGGAAGALFPALYTQPSAVGAGILLVIALCIIVRMPGAVPLSCIVYVSICTDPSTSVVWYAFNRFIDTATGAAGMAVNYLVKPYNNRRQVLALLREVRDSLPDLLRERVAFCRYPDLSGLQETLRRLAGEIRILDLQVHARPARRDDLTQLRGCQQLAERTVQELTALCVMDCPGVPDAESVRRLLMLGVTVPEPLPPANDPDSRVMNYHLHHLLDARDYLTEMIQICE